MAMMTTTTARAAATLMAIGLLAGCGSKHGSEREQAIAETTTDATLAKSSPNRDDAVDPDVASAAARAKAEMIVVFQEGVDEAAAKAMLDATRLPYRSGSDSSRGKAYFYAHGPQFIVATDTAGGAVLKNTLGSRPEVFEVYEADWEAQKD